MTNVKYDLRDGHTAPTAMECVVTAVVVEVAEEDVVIVALAEEALFTSEVDVVSALVPTARAMKPAIIEDSNILR